MLWQPTIMVKISVMIISTVNTIAIYGTIVVLEYAPVKWWLCRQSHVLPTLSQVNAQQVLWQKQALWQKHCDRLLDGVLCNHCVDSKDDAFAQGKGMDWIPDNCDQWKTVRRIFEQTVTYWEWQEPLMYANDEPQTMWAWNPLSNDH